MIAEPRRANIDIDGTGVHIAEWEPYEAADSPRGPHRIVLVHGLGGCTINWYLVGQPLADALGATVTALDLLGFGHTAPGPEGATFAANASLLRSFLRATGPATLVGNSMGGTLALRCAARDPELVDALVLVNPALPFLRGRPSPRHVRNLAVFTAASIPMAGPWIIDTRARRLGATRVVDESLIASGVQPHSFDADVRDALIELTAARYEEGIAGRAYHDAIRTMLPYLATVMPSDITNVRAPTLLVHGRGDPLVPVALAHDVSRRRPDWQVEVLDCGHLPLFEAPGALVDVVAGWFAGDGSAARAT